MITVDEMFKWATQPFCYTCHNYTTTTATTYFSYYDGIQK